MRAIFRVGYVVVGLTVGSGLASARQGTITALTLSTSAADAGATIQATASGSGGGCGAVHIDWGDGTAITYATSTLPVTQTHVYRAGGTFTVRARGMGNCSGEATARITITGPPPAPQLTAVALSSPSVEPRTAVTITVQGTGTCALTIDFGDGNTQEINATLPLTLRHTYALPGTYTITATPVPPCAERRTATLEVGRQLQRITGINVESAAGTAASARSIRVLGSGRCSYSVDFGDGNSETREAALPDVVRHNYPAAGRYTVTATARPPCSGVQRSTFVIGAAVQGSISRVDVRPQLARVGQPITVTVAGSGTCRFVVDFDDGESRTLTERLPYQFTYRYAVPGDFEIVAWAHEPCTGQGDALLRIGRR